MSRNRFIELEPDAMEVIRGLMPAFGETDVATTVSRALGLAKVASRYFADGKLTVLDPNSTEPELADQLVDVIVMREPSYAPAVQAA